MATQTDFSAKGRWIEKLGLSRIDVSADAFHQRKTGSERSDWSR